MGAHANDDDRPFAASGYPAAIVISRNEFDGTHAGLLYKVGAEVRVIHFAWDDRISDEWSWDRIWAAPEVEPEEVNALRGWCLRVLKTYQDGRGLPNALRLHIAYGVQYGGAHFTQVGFKLGLRIGDDSIGLTCATFILALYKTVKVQLVNEESWPIRQDDDRAWLAKLRLDTDESHAAPKPKDEAEREAERNRAQRRRVIKQSLTDEVERGVRRLRPEEVLAACNCELPANFQDCEATSLRILAGLPPYQGKKFPP